MRSKMGQIFKLGITTNQEGTGTHTNPRQRRRSCVHVTTRERECYSGSHRLREAKGAGPGGKSGVSAPARNGCKWGGWFHVARASCDRCRSNSPSFFRSEDVFLVGSNCRGRDVPERQHEHPSNANRPSEQSTSTADERQDICRPVTVSVCSLSEQTGH